MRKEVSTSNAPAAIGPYSQAIDADGMVFCSGQVGLDPATQKLAEGIEAQTEQALRNLAAVLQAAGLSLADVVKTTLWLTDSADFAPVNAVYARHFQEPAPARSAPIVSGIPLPGARISIEAIAVRPTARRRRESGCSGLADFVGEGEHAFHEQRRGLFIVAGEAVVSENVSIARIQEQLRALYRLLDQRRSLV